MSTKVVLISGKAGSGKDTLASLMINELMVGREDAVVIHFGDLVKDIAKQIYGWDEKKDDAGRELLQYIGETFRKYRKDFWVDYVIGVIKLTQPDYVIIPDTRYQNEISRMKEEFKDVITVRLEGRKSQLTPEQLKHKSEIDLDNYEFDHVFENDGFFGDLYEKMKSQLFKSGMLDFS